MRDIIDAGADGVFFSIQGCSREIMTEQQYREFGRPYDLMALRGGVVVGSTSSTCMASEI